MKEYTRPTRVTNAIKKTAPNPHTNNPHPEAFPGIKMRRSVMSTVVPVTKMTINVTMCFQSAQLDLCVLCSIF